MCRAVSFQESTPNAGEAMATKDGISVCSIDSNKDSGRSVSTTNGPQQLDLDDDISSITLATDNKYSTLCKYAAYVGWLHSRILCAVMPSTCLK